MKAHRLTHLPPRDQQAIDVLIERLLAEHDHHVLRLMMFGSKARGNDTKKSDIDALVVTTSEDWSLKHHILILGARVSLESDVLFNLYVIGRERWAWMRRVQHPLYRAIMISGLDLTPEPVSA